LSLNLAAACYHVRRLHRVTPAPPISQRTHYRTGSGSDWILPLNYSARRGSGCQTQVEPGIRSLPLPVL